MALGIYYAKKYDTLLIKVSTHRHDSILNEGDVTKMFKDNQIVSLNIKNASKIFNNIQPGMQYPSNELLTKINMISKTDFCFNHNFVVAFVDECNLVEGTHLHQLSVNIGNQDNLQIVCGASNIAKGQKVVLCTIDTFMPDGTYVSNSALRGIDSFGMICSQKELNISGFNDSGIIVLPNNYQVGAEFYGSVQSMLGLILGYIGGTIIISSFFMQMLKTIRDKNLKDLNIITFIVSITACSLWMINGWFASGLLPIVITNIILCFINTIIVYVYFKKKTSNIKVSILITTILSFITITIFTIYLLNGENGKYIKHNSNTSLTVVIIAGVFTASTFLPQTFTTIKLKTTKNLSFWLLFLNSTAQVLLLLFWILKSQETDIDVKFWLPGTIFTLITGLIGGYLLFLKSRDLPIFNKLKK